MSSASRRRSPRRRSPRRRGRGYEADWFEDEDEYGYDYPYDPGDDRWEEGTGGMFSPVRVLLGLFVIASGAAVLYGMFIDQTARQMPIMVSGLAVLGLSLGLLAISSARGAASLGRRGHGGKALLAALFGGFCAIGSAGSLAGALVLGMIALSA